MFSNVQSIKCDSEEGSDSFSTSVDVQALRLSGWYRLKINLQDQNLQKVSLVAIDGADRPTAFEVVCGSPQFRCFIYLSNTIRRLDVGMGKQSKKANQASISFRRISPLEFAWKSIRSGFFKQPMKFLAYFSDPFDSFRVSFGFPIPRDSGDDYASWIKLNEADVTEAFRSSPLRVAEHPEISILMTVCDPQPRYLKEAIESVINQTSPNWRLSIADDASVSSEVRSMLEQFSKSDPRIRLTLREQRGGISAATNTAFEGVSSPLVTCLDHDDTLSKVAVEVAAQHFASNPDCKILFSDEDKIDERGRRFEPFFKPERFSPEMFYSCNYLNHLTVHRAETIRHVGGWRSRFDGAQDYDLLLRSIKKMDFNAIQHIPLILYHWRAIAGSAALNIGYKSYAIEKGRCALEDHFLDDPSASISITSKTLYRVERRLPADEPGVAILVPFRDRPDFLATCADGILNKTAYKNLELVLIDNGSVQRETLDLIDRLRHDPRVKIITDNSPFNYSRLNNIGAKMTDKDYVCLLNNDIEIIKPDWLSEMMSYALVEGVGCVGAKLYYPSGSIQHAGVILGGRGVARHAFLNKSADDPGYFARLCVASNYSALTAACLLVKRETFFRVGGLDERDLTVAFNDIDFCIKVQALGLRNVLTPFAELIHHESTSRGADSTPEKAARLSSEVATMSSRHADIMKRDPWYSPHLSLQDEDFTIRRPSEYLP